VAREEKDAFWLLGEIKRCGGKLESTLERIDDSPQGLLLFAIMAGVNAFRSRGDGEKVKMGLERKFADGGTLGPARTGYLNVREQTDGGREVRSIALDEDRCKLIQLASTCSLPASTRSLRCAICWRSLGCVPAQLPRSQPSR
jgi:DNA invertase Pin-like site-specific DNA recombinase